MTHPCNHNSHVTACTDCGGTGEVSSHRQPTTGDPYPSNPCECGLGDHDPECAVCGFGQIIPGYDCLVCETVISLFPADLTKFDPIAFAAALILAKDAAMADFAQAEALAA